MSLSAAKFPQTSARAWNSGWVALPALWRSSTTAASCMPPALSPQNIEPTRVYKVEEARDFLTAAGLDADTVGPQIDGKFVSAFIRANKPARRGNVIGPSCCGPSCCA